MVRTTLLTSLLASSAMLMAVTTPAHAGKTDRAQEAIAAAEAKVHTAESLGTGVEVPAATAAARAALATAREDLASHHRETAIQDAIHASALADTAIGELQRRHDAAMAAARVEQHENAVAAQNQVDAARQQAAAAQQEAAAANARADAAQQAAASSAADADAARTAAAMAATPPAPAQPAQVQTTVTTEHTAPTHHAAKSHVVKRTTTTTAAPAATSSDQVTATTTVTH